MCSPRYRPCCVRTSPRSFIPRCSFIRSPCARSPLRARSYPPRSPCTCSPSFVPSLVFICTPSDSFVALALCSFVRHARSYPTLPLYLLTLVRPSPVLASYCHCCCRCRCCCRCAYALAGSLVRVRPPCACPSVCGTSPVTE